MTEVEVEEKEKDFHYIDVYIGTIKGLRPVYQCSDIILKVEFLSETLLKTEKIRLDEIIDINTSITLQFDYDDPKTYDNYISHPLIVTVIETEGEIDHELEVKDAGKAIWHNEDSLEDLKVALEGKKELGKDFEKADSKSSKKSKGSSKKSSKKDVSVKGSKVSKASKTSKGSKASKKSKGSKNSSKAKIAEVKVKREFEGPQLAGQATIDLLPLFTGENFVNELLVLKGDSKKALDDRVRSVALLPQMQIELNIDKPIPAGEILNITLESIYNLPGIFTEDMSYQLAFEVPSTTKTLVNFNICKYAEQNPEGFQKKKWFGTQVDSQYFLEEDLDKVKNCVEGDLKEISMNKIPRLEFNQIKRCYLKEDDLGLLKRKIEDFKVLPIEFYMKKPGEEIKVTKEVKVKKSKDKSSKGSKSGRVSRGENERKVEDYLHMMGFIDACKLLYPGENTVRVACPLWTYNEEEIQAKAGVKDSYFRPKPEVKAEEVKPAKEKKGKKKGGKESKSGSSKKSSSKKDSKKGSKKGSKKDIAIGDLKGKLGQAAPKPEPSQQIFSDVGLPTFLIFEISLRNPLIPPKVLEDISEDLMEILNKSMAASKPPPPCIKSGKISEDFFLTTIKNLTKDLKSQRNNFVQDNLDGTDDEKSFLSYLQRKGVYQTYLNSIVKASVTYVKARHPENSAEEQLYISKVFVELIEKMNVAINELLLFGEDGESGQVDKSGPLKLDYALEASELGATGLANRYYLEMISEDESKPNYWFLYSVFNLGIGEIEKGIECALEALNLDHLHKNSLVLYGLMLARKNRLKEAETCLLNVTVNFPEFVEAWGALYCIYKKMDNIEGMEVAEETGEKNLTLDVLGIKDLFWTNFHIPNTLFFRTTCYLISLRLLEEAEIVLSEEIAKKATQFSEYLLAVISYYKQDYSHAILHIDNSITLGGCDYITCILRGHILFKQDDYFCAIQEYQKIFEFYSKPQENFLYFTYILLGLSYSHNKNSNDSRLAFLQAAKIRSSPYIWLCIGVLYYHQQEFNIAEECLTQANSMDNRMPEVWAYLTLVNIQLQRKHEADMCKEQMLKIGLENEELLFKVNVAMKEMQIAMGE